jgi:Leucine-rich repeat (LRR) protein
MTPIYPIFSKKLKNMIHPQVLARIEHAYQKKSTTLNLCGCGLTEVPIDLLKLAPFLTRLEFERIPLCIADINDPDFEKETTYFGGNEINDDFIKQIATHFTKLTYLSLYCNYMTLDGFKAMMALKNLTHFVAIEFYPKKRSHERQVPFLIAANLKNLTHLYISIGMSPKGVDVICENLPQLAFLSDSTYSGDYLAQAAAKYLKNLKYLSIHTLKNKSMEWIATMHHLTHLQIQGTIKDTTLKQVSSMQNLQYLDISNDKLGDEGAESISNLQNLEHLAIYSNNISDKGAHYITNLSRLKHLTIHENKMTALGLRGFEQLSQLEYLDIHDICVDLNGLELLVQLKKLKYLHLYTTAINTPFTNLLTTLNDLETLNWLGGDGENESLMPQKEHDQYYNIINIAEWQAYLTALTDKKNDRLLGIEYFKKLKNLNFSYNNLSDNDLYHIAQIKTLEVLTIMKNFNPPYAKPNYTVSFLSENGLKHLTTMQNLIELNVPYNNIDANGAKQIGRIKNLKRLNIKDNAIGDEGVKAFQSLVNLEDLSIVSNQILDAHSLLYLADIKSLTRVGLEFCYSMDKVFRDMFDDNFDTDNWLLVSTFLKEKYAV